MNPFELLQTLATTNNQFIDSLSGSLFSLNMYGNKNLYSLIDKDDLNHLIYLLKTHRVILIEVNDNHRVEDIDSLLVCLQEIKETDMLSLVYTDKINSLTRKEIWATETLNLNDYPDQYTVLNPIIHEVLLELKNFCNKLPGTKYQFKVKSNPTTGRITVRIFNQDVSSFQMLDLTTTDDESYFRIVQDSNSVTLRHPKHYYSFKTVSNDLKRLDRNFLLDMVKFALFKLKKKDEVS